MPPCMLNRRPPWIVFVDPDPTGSSKPPVPSPPPGTQTPEEFLAEHGFPKDTAVDDMTPEQGRAYWRNMSKTNQKEAEAFRKLGKTPDEIRTILADAETARQAALTADQKAIEDAKQTGFSEAREKFARPAVHAILVARTKGAKESDEDAATRVSGLLDVLDVTKFVNAEGVLDASKVETFAQSIASKDSNDGTPGGGLLHQVLGSSTPGQQQSAGSVDAYRKQARERMAPKQ
ncbi:hypothetical protein [Microbacterium lacus]|uniref:hypothetical protein n=1 Tax=Microbacterium lacus TaxID=415217 RepID=UPI0012FDA09D|nr:hypothetical protein [Microbacterium lacus]